MPRKPRMRTRAEIISALHHARNRHAAEESKSKATEWGTQEHRPAHTLACIWQGEVQAYRFALRVEPHAPDPTE